MLAILTTLEIVKKEHPIRMSFVKPEGKTSVMPGNLARKSVYRLADFMFRFRYRFVLPNLSRISMSFGKEVWAEVFGKTGGKIET